MNKLLRKAAAIITAGLMAVASLGVESFAESAKLYTESAELEYGATVAKPTYTVKGTAGVRQIRLSTSTSGATIYYTTNGKAPTTKSKKYTGKLLQITKNTKICAIAVKGSSKSAVMAKTFYVSTKYGDVTGDGKINSTDYTRLKNFLAGKTSYICKDNADCDGSGGISSKDLTVLNQYLSGKISRLPSSPVATVKKPTATKSKVYGGMKITLKTTVSGATIYYTTNGSTPTTSSNRYNSPFTLERSATIKAINYKNGESSEPLTFNADVGTTQSVQADKNTSTSYTEAIDVKLSCYTSNSIIYYTTDGSDPRTSSTAKSYSNSIRITQDTTIKAYARSKGNTDSDVSTFSYRVKAGFTIGGVVWDDTPGSVSSSSSSSSVITANGSKASNEPGISGMTVYLVNSTTSAQDAPYRYIQKTTTNYNGEYSFTGLTENNNYKVVFEYNYQKYRAYPNIVSSGNQALSAVSIPDLKVEDNGTYAVSGYSESFYNSIVSYGSAVNSNNYVGYAITSNSYSSTNQNVNFAVISKNYGILKLDMTVTGATNNKIAQGKRLTYTITLTNNSPVSSTILSDAEIGVYMTDAFSTINLNQRTASINANSGAINAGARYIMLTDFISSGGLAPGRSATVTLEATVDDGTAINTRIEAYAEVTAYRFATSCYDYYSTPGNMSLGRVSQNTEAAATVITVTPGSSSETTQTINAITGRTSVDVGFSDDTLMFVVENCTSQTDILPGEMSPQGCLTYTPTYTTVAGNMYVSITVYGTYPGDVAIPFYLRKDPSKSITLYATVNPILY
ncbi:MAG: chitobiase/beta-hexosaminidase C-terminal domain-containing protein [Ruminiclostridium sp.]|nr:chitobiase/beta-hexosaminidase C-terminal domain-containing protein [Ruminiclostridium sp.]